MGKILVTLGGVIVILLFAALVAPYFIDWNHYKTEIESRSAMFFGRPVHIDGQITVRLLPQPVLRIHDVRIDGAGKDVLLAAKAIEARLAVEPLLKSNVEITHVELVEPVLTLVRGADGRGSWKPGAGAVSALSDPDQVSVQNLHIQGGRIVYRDIKRDMEKTIGRIDADLNAAGLRGPFKISGTFGDAGTAFKMATGRLSGDDDFRMTGRITGGFGEARLSGQFQDFFDKISFAGKLVYSARKNTDNRIYLSTETRIALNDSVLKLEDVTGTIGEGSAAMGYKGALNLDWGVALSVSGAFSARRADLDGLLGKGKQTAGGSWLQDLLKIAPPSLPQGVRGAVDFKVDGGLLGGKSFSDLALKLVSDGRKMSIAGLNVILPGQSGLEVTGDFAEGGQGRAFSGAFKVNTPDLRQFLSWTGYEGAFAPRRGALSLRLGGNLHLSAQGMEIAAVKGKLGAKVFHGAFSHDYEKDSWKLEASIDALDLDRYFEDAKGGANSAPLNFSLVRPSIWAARFPVLLQGKSDLSVNIGALTHGGRLYNGFAGSLRFNNGDLAIHQIAYSSQPDGNVLINGNIANLRARPKTHLQIKLVAPDMTKAVPAGLLDDFPDIENAMAGLGAADLDLRFTGVEDAKQVILELRGGGKLGTSKAQIEAHFSGVPERVNDGQISWKFRLENPLAKALLDQLHIPKAGAPWGRGKSASTFAWEGKGAINLLLPFKAALHLPGAEFSLKGTIEKDKRFRLSDARLNFKVEDQARLKARLSGRAGEKGAATPLTLTASLDGGQDDLSIAGASGAAGGAPFTAHGRVKLDGKIPQITLNLKPERFDLSLLLEGLFGVDDAKGGEERALLWSASVLDTSALHNFSLDLDIETPQMILRKNLLLKQAALNLRSGAGVFEIQALTGKLMGASLLASVRLEDDGNGILKGGAGLVLEGVRVPHMLKGAGERAVLGGVMSIKADLETRGRSLAGMISALSGSGEIELTGGEVLIPDLFATALVTQAAQRAGELEKAIKNSIGWRLTPFAPGPARAKISNGILRIEKAPFSAGKGKGDFSVIGDIAGAKLDAKWTFPLPNLKSAPPLGVIYSGPYAALERRADYSALTRYITRKRIEREAEDSRKKATGPKTGEPPAGLIQQNVTDLPGLSGGSGGVN